MKKKHATPEQFLLALAYEFPGLLYSTTNHAPGIPSWIAEQIKHLSPRLRATMKSMACVSMGDKIGVRL